MKKLLIVTAISLISIITKAQTFSWSGLEPIMDMQSDTIQIPISGLPTSIDTSFGLAHICFNITHTYDADLVIKLLSPSGNSVTLIQGIGGSGDNFWGTCVGMDGTFFSNTTSPYTGIFVPIGNVASLNNGQNPNGIWKFIVSDIANADTGSIHFVSLAFTNNPPQQGSIGSNPTGTYVCATCVCPGGASSCDLLPDMISSAKEIQVNHTEVPGALYIANATPNIGYGPLEIYGVDTCFCGNTQVPCNTICAASGEIEHMIKQRIYQKVPGTDSLTFYDRTAGTMSYHPSHGHLHVDNFANYTLRSATSNPDATTWPIIGTGTKQSFCLINLGTCAGNYGQCKDQLGNVITTVPNQGLGFHTGCGLTQGIYAGSYDVYSLSLNDPIPLTNVCNGTYYIVSITDPENNFLESDETNNWVAVPITLTQQGTTANITASGPLNFCAGDSVILTSSFSSSYLWSSGETTQSIVVKNAGSYSVTVNCGTTSSTSTPVITSVIPINTNATVSITLSSGTNPSCPGLSKTFLATPSYGGASPVFQWKINGVNVGTNSNTYSTNLLLNGDVVTCELTSSFPCLVNSIAVSNAITMNIGTMICYCLPVYGTTANSGCLDGDVIARVILNTLDNNSGTGCASGIAGYSDYTTSSDPLHSTTLQSGNTYTCTVYAGQYSEGYKAWIDYNDDGIFSASEAIGNTPNTVAGSNVVGTIGSAGTFSVNIPCNIVTGAHRLRVRCSYNVNGASIDPCNFINNYGETEDYTIIITAPSGCSSPTAQTAINIGAKNATLVWTAGCNETIWNVHVTSPGGGAPLGIPSHPNVNNSYVVFALSPSTTYEYWVQANCGTANGTSIWVGPYLFTTLPLCATLPGTSFSNPIIIGELPCSSLPYVNTQTNTSVNCYSNSYTGSNNQAAPDVWYQFTLSTNATVEISTCASAFDTYLHLLSSTGTQLIGNDDNGPLCSGLGASISFSLTAGTYYVVAEGYGTNTGAIITSMKTTNICPVNTTLQLSCLLQGYWNGTNAMLPVLSNQGIAASANDCDSLIVELHANTPPYNMVYLLKTILHIDGTATCLFPLTYGNYYIVLKHRNAMQTWSATPIEFGAIPSNYDFTNAMNKAYGSNQVSLGNGKWALFSGDLNADENIDIVDAAILELDIFQFASGYYPSDLNGDGNVDLLDSPTQEVNINSFIYSNHP